MKGPRAHLVPADAVSSDVLWVVEQTAADSRQAWFQRERGKPPGAMHRK